jgi:thiol-disulfide isomerase/thioredoxin
VEQANSSQDPGELELVRAAGEPVLTQAYQSCLDLLEQSPGNPDLLLQRSFHLMQAASLLVEKDRDKSYEALDGALKLAQQFVQANAPVPIEYDSKLSQIFYNGACSLALQGQHDDAKAALRQAVKFGWDEMDYLHGDPDLKEVCQRPDFETDLAAWVAAARSRRIEFGRSKLAQGTSFPFDFTLQDLQGNVARLADFRGQVVIVNFWGTWCPPCREEIPLFHRLLNRYGDDGLMVVGLTYEQTGDAATNAKQLTEFLEGAQVRYPCVLGTEEIMRQVPDFKVFPTTLFVDRQGQVRQKLEGLYSYAYLESLVLALLAEPSESAGQTE